MFSTTSKVSALSQSFARQLRDGPQGFRALRARCHDVSPSVLSTRLGELVAAGVPAQDERRTYGVTPLGADLLAAPAPLTAWAERWSVHRAPQPGKDGDMTQPPAPGLEPDPESAEAVSRPADSDEHLSEAERALGDMGGNIGPADDGAATEPHDGEPGSFYAGGS